MDQRDTVALRNFTGTDEYERLKTWIYEQRENATKNALQHMRKGEVTEAAVDSGAEDALGKVLAHMDNLWQQARQT